MTEDSTENRNDRPNDDRRDQQGNPFGTGQARKDSGDEPRGPGQHREAQQDDPDGTGRPAVDERTPDGGDQRGAGQPQSTRARRAGRSAGVLTGGDVWTKLLWVSLGVLGLLAAFSLLQFYGHASTAIDVWVGDRYRPVAQAAFNLAVLLAAGGGIAVVVRRIGERRSSSPLAE